MLCDDDMYPTRMTYGLDVDKARMIFLLVPEGAKVSVMWTRYTV